MPDFNRSQSVEDELKDFLVLRDLPFTDDCDKGTLPAVAVDWDKKNSVFNVTMLSISHDGSEERLWSDSFSIRKIERRHFVLCLVHQELQSALPKLPKDEQGIWWYIRWTYVSPQLCKKLEEYFKNAFQICGWKLFTSVFFGEPLYFDEDYTISTLELKRKRFVKVVEETQEGFQEHITKKDANSMNLFEWYDALWDCMTNVTDAERKLLAFDCEPYEELRDIAQKERTECATMFNQQSMTTSTFQNNVQTFSEWEDQYIDSVKHINQFRIAHFKISLPRLQQISKLLREDSEKFTEDKKIFVATKLYQFEKESLQNEIEMLNCSNQLKLLERDRIRRDALALDEDISMPEKLNEKEIQVYTKQCEILVLSCDIQEKNEKIVRLDLQQLSNDATNEESEKLRANLHQNLVSISRKKAFLRNKKNICEAEIKKLTRNEEVKEEQYVAHHAVQMKIEKRREEDEEKKDARLEKRQKTLMRLKEYKRKYPKAKETKPPRYQPPSMRKGLKVGNTSSSATTTNESASSSKSNSRKSENKKESPRSPEENGSFEIISSPPLSPQLSSSQHPSPQLSSPQLSAPQLSSPQLPSPQPPSSQPSGIPSIPPPPPPPPPPLPPPGIPHHPPSLPVIKSQRIHSSERNKSPVAQANSLSQQTLDLDSLNIARSRLKKRDKTPAANNNERGFPSGNQLTIAIQSVKLRRVVSEEKPAALSPDGAEFLKKALERMNKFTTLSFEDEEGDMEEQDW